MEHHHFTGERTLMRIFIGERDRYGGHPLYEALLRLLRERGFAGATVIRAIAGFGAQAKLHTDKILRLSFDLPVIIEVVDTEERIQSILPDLDDMVDGGIVTLERARVIMYRPHDLPEDERWRDRIRGLDDAEGQADE